MKDYSVMVHKSSNRTIDYTFQLGCYEFQINMPPSERDDVIHIVDAKTMEEALLTTNAIRSFEPYAPIIILVDIHYQGSLHDDIMKINGYGKLEFVFYYDSDRFHLLEYVDGLAVPKTDGNMSEIAIVIPVYNEASRLKYVNALTGKIKRLVEQGDYSITIYYIDDGSEDDTVKELQLSIGDGANNDGIIYASQMLNLRVLKTNTRKAGTYLDAFSAIDAEYIVTIDADDSFQMEDVVKLIHLCKVGYYDMVIGTKDDSVETRLLVRQILSGMKRLLTKMFLPRNVSDSQTGLKVFKKQTVQMMLPYLNINYGLALDLEMLYLAKKMHLRVLQKSVTIIDREGSHINIVKDTIAFVRSMASMLLHQKYRKLV